MAGARAFQVIDTSTNQIITQFNTLGADDLGLAISPDGRFVYVSDFDGYNNPNGGEIDIFNTVTQVFGETISFPTSLPAGSGISADGQYLYVFTLPIGGQSATAIAVVSTTTNSIIGTIPLPFGATTCVLGQCGGTFTPDGRHAYVVNQNDKTQIAEIDTGTGQVISFFSLQYTYLDQQQMRHTFTFPVSRISFTLDGTKAYVEGRGPGDGDQVTVMLAMATATNSVITNVQVSPQIAQGNDFAGPLVCGPRGQCFLSDADQGGYVFVINTGSNSFGGSILAGQEGRAAEVLTPDGRFLYVPPLDYEMRVIDTTTDMVVALINNGTNINSMGSAAPPFATFSAKTLGDCPCKCAGCAAAGEPVTISSGNVFEKVEDYKTAGANPLEFTRYYNSLANASGIPNFAQSLGVNWRSTYDRYLHISPPTGQALTVLAERADGQILTFTYNNGNWISDSDVDLQLSEAGPTWTLKDRDDTIETYTADDSGRGTLNSIRARNGYTRTLHYDANNLLARVTDSYSRSLSFTYLDNTLIQTVTTPDSLVLNYGYNFTIPGIQLSQIIYNNGSSQSYLYEDATLPFALTGMIDENGNRYATWTYDDMTGRALTSQHGNGADLTTLTYNDNDGSRTVNNALGVSDTYSFTTLQGVPKVTQISRAATATTQAAQRQFTYDGNGYLASQTDWNGNVTSYVNDSHGQPTQITEPLRTTTVSYDPTFVHLPHQIVTTGQTSTFAYDGSGNLLTRTDVDTTTQNIPYSTNGTTEVWTYTWQNNLLASIKTPRTDVNGLTQFTYDGSGALTAITNALGQQTRITQHTGGGLPLTVNDPNSVTTTLTYDGRLHLNTSTVHTAAGSLTTTYTYDPAGNLQSVQLPDGSMLTNGYDTAHRLTSITDLFGQSTAYTLDALGDQTLVNVLDANHTVKKTHSGVFDALGRVLQDIGGVGQTTAYTYDNNGNALTVTDPLTNRTTRVFDALNRLTTSTDPDHGVTNVTYDAHDRPLTVIDPNDGQTAYTYDGFGNPIQQVSPDSGTTVYYYDLDNNLVKRVAATNAVTQLTYDALDRVLTTTYPSDPSENVTYTYDQPGHGFGVGRLTSVADAAGSLARSYDERGNITQEARLKGTLRLNTFYAYDAASRLASIVYPSLWRASYSRDIMGRITGIKAGLIVASVRQSITPLPVVSNISYEPFGPVTALTFGNNVAETRSFDLDYRLTNLSDTGNAAVQNLTYAYDAGDNVRTITDSVNPGNSQTLGYDVLNRLSSATGGYGNYSWTYNPASSRLTETLGMVTTSYGYGAHNNQLLTLTVNGIVTQNIGYTADGNSNSFNPGIMSPDHALITSLDYNQAGQLAAVMSGSDALAQYTYDAFGQRLVKALTGGAGAIYQNDREGRLLEETDAHGVAQADYIYLDGRPVATISPSSKAVYFLHADRLGTPQLATDSVQQTAWSATYLPFGQTSSVQGLITQNLRLPGQNFDSESGWNHNGFRDYAQDWGRYLQTDVIGLKGGLNTYQYVRANPLKFADRRGLDWTDNLPQPVPIGESASGANPRIGQPLTPQQRQNLVQFLDSLSNDSGYLAGFSLSNPLTFSAAPFFGGLSACAAEASYLLKPAPNVVDADALIDFLTAPLPPVLGTFIGGATKQLVNPYIPESTPH